MTATKTDTQEAAGPAPSQADLSAGQFTKAIHLLYVPTKFCNMSCRYCYLGNLTAARPEPDKVLGTLNTALEQLLAHGYLPFNLSFHGGEVTTLPT
ncbi:MAG: hypothetical protein D3904_13290 [Candidatus Electrothrix sp. EH2]|nr:hypothetical protein [Candidatus Electrothrix sp. EH2]